LQTTISKYHRAASVTYGTILTIVDHLGIDLVIGTIFLDLAQVATPTRRQQKP
jgi:hypothetical protein